MTSTRRWYATGCVLVLFGTGLAACGSDSSSGHAEVDVTLSEWVVQPEATSAKPGTVEFEAENKGSVTHEMALVAAQNVAALPTRPDGSVDEGKIPAADKFGEVADVAPGKDKDLKANLKAGSYVLYCNIVERDATTGTMVSHFQKGMHSTFTVE